jgi:hypothetical protein
MAADKPDPDELLNREFGVDHAEFVRPSAAEPAKPPEQCAECGSSDVRRIRKLPAYGLFLLITFGLGIALDQTFAAFLIALAGSIFFLIAPRWRCDSCGNRWSST